MQIDKLSDLSSAISHIRMHRLCASCPGHEVIKLFFMLNSAEHENPAHKCLNANNCWYSIAGILTFISRISTTSECFKARTSYIFRRYSFYEQIQKSKLNWKFNLFPYICTMDHPTLVF